VHVHVPKAGNQESAASVNDVCRFLDFDLGGRADCGNSVSNNHNGLIWLRSAPRPVENGDVLKDKRSNLAGAGYQRKNGDQKE
jgi:hypothetical protein